MTIVIGTNVALYQLSYRPSEIWYGVDKCSEGPILSEARNGRTRWAGCSLPLNYRPSIPRL
jgi:hypothetical protein